MSDRAVSYVHGAIGEPLLGLTIGQALDRAAAAWPDHLALVAHAQGVRWTWRELRDQADAFAAGLLALGLRPGDRIGIWSLNRAEWVLTQFAAARAGLILVTINPAYRLSELEFALNNVGCTALVTATAFKTSDYLGMLGTLAPELAASGPGRLSAARLPHLRTVIQIGGPPAPGTVPFDAVAARGDAAGTGALRDLADAMQFDDAANIQFTSGTTGAPKGVTLTHHNILNNGHFVGRAMRLTAEDRICIPVPLYHCFGMVMGNLAALTHGCAMVFPGEGFDPRATLETVQAERCTALYGVPTMFIAELDHPEFARFDLRSLRTGIMAGAPCPIAVMRRVVEEMNMRDVTIAYGMTETSPVSFQSSSDDPLERRVTTVGRIHPHLEVKIVDPEGRVTPRGERGELCTRGYSVMLGYWATPRGPRRFSTPPDGCTPATSRRWTRRATATSSAGSKTWSYAVARTSIRARSRSSSSGIRRSRTSRSSGSPTRNTGRSCAPGSGCATARPCRSRRCARSARGRSRIRRSRNTSSSSTPSR